MRRFRAPRLPARPLPDWWNGSAAPLVYVSFGSSAAGNGFFPDVYREAAEALGELPVRVLLTLGTEVDPADLGPVAANVHVEPWVPQGAVMAHASAMVGHGGSGSTLAAMAAGMPLAVVPLFADQPENADRVAELGAGLRLDGTAPLADAIIELLDDPFYRANARSVAAEIEQLPPVDDAVAVLEALGEASWPRNEPRGRATVALNAPPGHRHALRRHREELLLFLARRTADPQIALDLWAETFAQAVAGQRRYRGTTPRRPRAGCTRSPAASSPLLPPRPGRAACGRKLGSSASRLARAARRHRAARRPERAARGARRGARPALARRARAVQLRIVDELPYPDLARSLGIASRPPARASRAGWRDWPSCSTPPSRER